MSTTGGQPGNQNARRGRVWRDAIERAMAKRSRADMIAEMDALAEQLLRKCDEGDVTALRELGDRLEGKSAQPVTNEVGDAFVVKIEGSDAQL